MKYLTSPLFVLCIMFSSFAHAQLNNPNKLPPCPKPDYSNKSDAAKTAKWNKCFGKITIEFSQYSNGDVYEGEFNNGKLNGYGVHRTASGNIYSGMFKDGNWHGQGSLHSADGVSFIGEYKNGIRNGFGIEVQIDGSLSMGIWKSFKLIRSIESTTEKAETFVSNLNNPNNLPSCPKSNISKSLDVGVGGKTEKWNNCWGILKIELNKDAQSEIGEGEWRNGLLDGLGSYTYSSGDKYIGFYKGGRKHGHGIYIFEGGESYVGEMKFNNRHGIGSSIQSNGNKYVGEYNHDRPNGQGIYTSFNGDKYEGNFKNGKANGNGKFIFSNGDSYIGEFKENVRNGKGIFTFSDGHIQEGIWENDNFVLDAKVNLPNQNNNVVTNIDRSDIDRERQQLAEERRRLDNEKRQRQQASSNQRINLQVTNSQPTSDGVFFIDIKTNADTASLLIDGKEEGGKSDGNYTLKRIARAGQSSSFKIVATDIYGNTDTKTINVTRTISEAKATYADLNPTNIKRKSDRDAVAIIIGISEYKNLPKADFANDDARVFYDYAIRALSIKPDNIKLLVDGDASEVGIYKAFKTWLPSKVRSSTDVYVFYSGHGLPTSDGKGLYLLPQQTDRDLISKTAIQMQEVISDIQSTKPKSVTLFLDACYSGQSRTGETLIASARPLSIKSESRIFPENFAVITASQNDQISSSNPDLKHGIFSYYLMRGMEGDADTDKDGKITLGEMQSYLVENVGRQAGMMNRKQEPQLIGDTNRVLVGR